MKMKQRNEGLFCIFELEGHLDFETTQRLGEKCKEFAKTSPETKVVFNMEKLKFVGSSGINQFVDVLTSFNRLPQKPRYCQVSTDFQKIFKALQPARNPFVVVNSEIEALTSFDAITDEEPKKDKKKGAPAIPRGRRQRNN